MRPSTRRPTIDSIDWARKSLIRTLAPSTGIAAATAPLNTQKKICGRQLDSSVTVGGTTGLVSLLTRFPGGMMRNDGSMVSIDGATDSSTFPWAPPSTLYLNNIFSAGTGYQTSGTNVGWAIQNSGGAHNNDGYLCVWTAAGKVEIHRIVAGVVQSASVSVNGPVRDRLKHTLAITISMLPAISPNYLQRSITFSVDGTYIARFYDNQNTCLLDPTVPLKETVYTAGNDGSVFDYQAGMAGIMNSSSGANGQGSLVTNIQNPIVFNYNVTGSTTATIQPTWPTFEAFTLDQGIVQIASGSGPVFNVVPAATYYFLTYYDFILGVQALESPNASGTAMFTLPAAMNGNYDGQTLININIPVAVPAYSGGGGNTGSHGGGGDNCPAWDEIIQARRPEDSEPTLMKAHELRPGDWLPGVHRPFEEVLKVERRPGIIIPVKIHGEWIHNDADHLWLLAGGDPNAISPDWVRSYDLSLNTLIEGADGVPAKVEAIGEAYHDDYIRIVCTNHVFIQAGVVVHNFNRTF